MSKPSPSRPPLCPVPAPDRTASLDADVVPCERCGVAMFRMHAVWRCPACGFKADCCGW